MLQLVALVLGSIVLSVLLMSSAGIYALISFIVSPHRKEIGIRAALGADPRRLLTNIVSRAFRRLLIGAAAGAAIAAGGNLASDGELLGEQGPLLLLVVAALIVAVGLLAALGPARRGLRIDPTTALRED